VLIFKNEIDTPTFNFSFMVGNPNKLEEQIPVRWINTQVKVFKINPKLEPAFVLTHRPYYVNGITRKSDYDLAQGTDVWPAFE
jgi:hypothetical protein